jgi:hypothetical protein
VTKNIKALTQYIRKTPHTIKNTKKDQTVFFYAEKGGTPNLFKAAISRHGGDSVAVHFV